MAHEVDTNLRFADGEQHDFPHPTSPVFHQQNEELCGATTFSDALACKSTSSHYSKGSGQNRSRRGTITTLLTSTTKKLRSVIAKTKK